MLRLPAIQLRLRIQLWNWRPSDSDRSMAYELPRMLPFPLYHGTNTIWRESIGDNGLGGKNIVEELGVVEFLQTAVICLDSLQLCGWPDRILAEQVGLRAMALQHVTDGGFNFRHG